MQKEPAKEYSTSVFSLDDVIVASAAILAQVGAWIYLFSRWLNAA